MTDIKDVYDLVKNSECMKIQVLQITACCFALSNPTFEECQTIGKRAWKFWIDCLPSCSFQQVVDIISDIYINDDLNLNDVAAITDDDISLRF